MQLTTQQAISRVAANPKLRRVNTYMPRLTLADTIGSGEAALFLFRKKGGGIIAPANDALPPVLADFDCDSTDKVPPAMLELLDGYIKEFEWLRKRKSRMAAAVTAQSAKRAMATSQTTVSPLMNSKWNQGKPYNGNIKCDGKLQLVGCNATAMAQIIFYWYQRGIHRGCKATPAYTTASNKYAIAKLPPITIFDYKNFTPDKPKTAAEKLAVATLCEYCAKAIRSDFTPNDTSAYPATTATALKTYFRLGSDIKMIYASKVGKAEFLNTIIENINNKCPVIIAGSSSKSGGHTFVCDGYNPTTNMFHINWGWGGQYNGWFALTALTPGDENYNGNQRAIVNIRPEYILGDVNSDGKVNISDVVTTINLARSGNSTAQSDVNSDGKTTIDDANIISQQIATGDAL